MPRDYAFPAFLNVEASLTGRRWIGPSLEEDRLAAAMERASDLPGPLCRVLVRRGVTPDEAEAFLAPALRDLLPDPMALRDMGPATERLLQAVRRGERIAIFADYDVDGGASAALLLVWLRAMGREATLYVPDRALEGYGPNAPAMAELAERHDLIVCVDCGTLEHEPIAAASRADVIVLDHHLCGETLPPALAVVNPNRQDEDGALSHLCAAAVVFLVLVEANRRLRADGEPGPDLMSLLDLVALATVADVAPLVGVNRALVRQGLAIMARRRRLGLAALADVARLDRPPTSYHLGFLIGPRINAGGRIGQADLGARLMSTVCANEAAALAERLDRLNAERRAIEAQVREDALAQAERRGLDAPLVWAAAEGWHPGVVGIVASRLKEATNRPAIVVAFEGDEGRGSGRSVAGVDLGASVHRVAAEGLLARGGGHRMAAGLTVDRASLEPAMERLGELLGKQGAGRSGPRDLLVDGLLMAGAATRELVERIEAAGPFGTGAPAPRFAFGEILVRDARRVGGAHLKLSLDDGTARLEAICFGAFEGPLGAALSSLGGRRIHAAGRLDLNHYNGRCRVQLCLDDVALA